MAKKKLAELVLYIARKSAEDRNFGSTKLNKILFYADFYYYGIKKKSISGCKYHHIQFGPAPKVMKPVIDELQASGRARLEESPVTGTKRVVPLEHADLSFFDKEEIQFVDFWIEHFRNYTGSMLSRETNELNAVLVTRYKEEIPYSAIFVLENVPVEIDHQIWARNKLKELRRLGYAH